VCAGFSGVESAARHDAESKGCDGGKGKSSDDAEADWSQGQASHLIFVVGTLSNGKGEAQIVGGGKAGVEEADDGKDDGSSADRGGEGVELAEEAASEGDADE